MIWYVDQKPHNIMHIFLSIYQHTQLTPRLFLTVAVPIVACTVLWLVHVMPSLNTPWHIKVSVSLAWFTALSCVIMMPLDVSRAYGNNEAAAGALPACWLTVYWYGEGCCVCVLYTGMMLCAVLCP